MDADLKEILDVRDRLFTAEMGRLGNLITRLDNSVSDLHTRINTLEHIERDAKVRQQFIITLSRLIPWLVPLGLGAAITALWEKYR